jgi:hypothetical protein
MPRYRMILSVAVCVIILLPAVVCAGADAEKAAPAFDVKPAVTKRDGGYVITFAVKSACDATVWVTDSKGEMVRRLASGRLGPNAPEPFQKASLAQELVWDGTDDRGKAVPAGCVVRVGLGLKAGFSRMLFEMEQGVAARGPASIACDARGNLYVMWGHMRSATLGGITINVSAFDRDGNYLRTVMPFRADWPKEKVSAVEFFDTADGRRVPLTGPNKHSPLIGFLRGIKGQSRHNAQITRAGRYIFPSATPVTDPAGVKAYRLLSIGTDGSCPGELYASAPLHEGATSGGKFLVLSPDEKYLYLSGTYHTGKRKRGHCVYRIRLGDTKLPRPFVGVECESGSDNTHLRTPRGIAVDSSGRLYVCDYNNDRIQIFSPGGAYLKTLGLPGPEQLVVHPKTGALYVLSIRDRGKTDKYVNKRWEVFADKSIVKYGSFDDLKETARIDFPSRPRYFHDCGPMLALDSSGEEPVVWLCSVARGARGEFLWKIVDGGTKLKTVEHNIRAQERWAARDLDEFFLAGEGLKGALRTKAGSGTVEPFPLPEGAEKWFGEIGAGPEGMLYLSCGKSVGEGKDMRWVVRRYGRDGKLVPFKSGEGIDTLGYHAGTHSGEMSGPFDVAPDGTIYVSECSAPGGKARGTLNVYGADGEPLVRGLIKETTHTAAPLAVDGKGRLYVADSVKRTGGIGVGFEFPAFLGRDPRGHFRFWYGTVFRFDPKKGGSIRHVGRDEKCTHVGGYPGGKGRAVVEGAEWEYFGMSPMPQSSSCECKIARIDADGFGRVFVPDVCTHSVQVLDPAGNLITRFGAYANWDAHGPASAVPKPEIPLYYPLVVAALDRYVAVSDSLNRRVVEVELSYERESEAPVPWTTSARVPRRLHR